MRYCGTITAIPHIERYLCRQCSISPEMVRYPALVPSYTQACLRDTPFCNTSRDTTKEICDTIITSIERKQKGGVVKGWFFGEYTVVPVFCSGGTSACTLIPVFVLESGGTSGKTTLLPNHPSVEAPTAPFSSLYCLLEMTVAELISVIVEVINHVKIISWIYFEYNCGSDYFPRLRCLCHESGQAITSEYFGGINFCNQAQNYFKNCVKIFWVN